MGKQIRLLLSEVSTRKSQWAAISGLLALQRASKTPRLRDPEIALMEQA
jgi:hypothetical protein